MEEENEPSSSNYGSDIDSKEKTHLELQVPCGEGPSAPRYEEYRSGDFVSVPLEDNSLRPPAYENCDSLAAPITVCPTAPQVNEGFVPDEDVRPNFKEPTAPEEESPDFERYKEIALSFPPLNEDDVRSACQQYADEHCCYGSRFVRRMRVVDIAHGIVFHYSLESFGEKRETKDEYTPYKGGHVDGPQYGPAPAPWSMNVRANKYFEDDEKRVEVPHTSVVKECHKCGGTGKVRCSSCSGSGYGSCLSCSGTGRNNERGRCISCSGRGRNRCTWCGGSGKRTCGKCDGYGKLRWYKVLIVTWKNHKENVITDSLKLPREKVLKALGKYVMVEEGRQLLPICDAPDASVNVTSTTLIQKHKTAFPSELIVKQRQSLRAVPLTRVVYQWKDDEGEYFIYGTENKAYFEDYPQKCCCCSIL